MIEEKIDHFHAPKIIFQIFFAIWLRAIPSTSAQRFARSVIAFKNFGVVCVIE